MSLISDIREGFAAVTGRDGIRDITSLPKEYPGYIVRISDGIGVAVEADRHLEISEHFNKCRLFSRVLDVEGKSSNYIILCTYFEEYRYEFASLCAEFLEPGRNGENRQSILNDPYKWWERWKELMGNTSSEQSVSSVIAEMAALRTRFKEDSSTVWAGSKKGSHDIECAKESYEVKSTLMRYGASVKISGQHQLEHKKRLWLYFCRLEESLEGESIYDLKEQLVNDGYDENKLEAELERQGFEKGSNIRNKKYKILEKRKYAVDESFPRIVAESFKNNKLPHAITHVEYTVDLDGVDFTVW